MSAIRSRMALVWESLLPQVWLCIRAITNSITLPWTTGRADYAKLAEFSERGVLALLADSTNAERPGWTPSERVVDAAFDDVFREARGRIIIASFASLVSRMQQVAEAAQRHGRKLAFVGTSMLDNFKMATKLEYLNIPVEQLVSIEDTKGMSDHKVVIMCTGSQGEPTSILGRTFDRAVESTGSETRRYDRPILPPDPGKRGARVQHYQ